MKLSEFYKLSDKQENQFEKYMKLLVEWNEKVNLTAITEHDDIILKHFVDSLTIEKYINNGASVIDVGTGAGFPGIPLKIYNESLDVTLLDSLNKRINFLNEVIKELDLEKIKTIHLRAEDGGKDKMLREKFDVATSRAVANLSTLSEYLLPFVKVGGEAICMKGPNVEDELKDAKKAIKILGGEVEKNEKIVLPNSDIERNIIIIKKVKPTPKSFPRKAGTPSKAPIK
jgi:16S rRNA (guanine527-N7)-methyltransferase